MGGGEDGGTKWNKHSLLLRFLKIISTSTIIVTSMYGWWRPRDHCFIGWNCFSTSKTAPTTTQGLIHYNFSVELPIQSFILPLCILFSDDTYEEHLAVITSSQMDARGRLSVSMILLLVRAGILNFTSLTAWSAHLQTTVYSLMPRFGDRYRKFYRTLNNAKKPFNSMFNSKNFKNIH